MNRGAVHIAFHYVPERLEVLDKTIGYLRTWDVETLDIFVHSNVDDPGAYKRVTWIWHKDLEHPFALTWLPAYTIKTQIGQYDFFVYLEDDIGIPKAAFEYWKRYPNPQTGFIRKNIITGEYDDIVSAGYTIENAFKETDHESTLLFRNGPLYKAFWINTNVQMKKYLSFYEDTTMVDIRKNLPRSRERAAFGNSCWFNTIFIKNEIENSIVWHLCKVTGQNTPLVDPK
jgi:hypothetical protein